MLLTDATLRTLKIDLPGNRVLRLALSLDEHGQPVDLTIACGFATDAPLRVLGSGVCVPAAALPELRDALQEIERR
jgi:hypothetical protein